MRYEASDQIFVAMPYSKDFEQSFEKVIEPAIKSASIEGRPLVPRIVNRGTTGAPDIHEQIFDAIIHSRLVIADMTVQSSFTTDDGKIRWQPNANVAYEVGLACAWRNAEDILLVYREREGHNYSFDVQNLRHMRYELDAEFARELSSEIIACLKSSRFIADAAFEELRRRLSANAISMMFTQSGSAFFGDDPHHLVPPVVSIYAAAYGELLEIGAIKMRNIRKREDGRLDFAIYEWAELGLRLMVSMQIVSHEDANEIRRTIQSIPAKEIPPSHLVGPLKKNPS